MSLMRKKRLIRVPDNAHAAHKSWAQLNLAGPVAVAVVELSGLLSLEY